MPRRAGEALAAQIMLFITIDDPLNGTESFRSTVGHTRDSRVARGNIVIFRALYVRTRVILTLRATCLSRFYKKLCVSSIKSQGPCIIRGNIELPPRILALGIERKSVRRNHNELLPLGHG